MILGKMVRFVWLILHNLERAIKRPYGNQISRKCETVYNKVVLSCNFGRGYLCNPKYIAEALNRLYPGEFDIVLLVRNRDSNLPAYLRQVRYGSREALLELATARFWVYNFRNDEKYVPKRDNQIYIQTWHGYSSPKAVEQDAVEFLSAEYIDDAGYDGSITDLMIANNDFFYRVYHESFWYNGPVMRCGIPRNRPLIVGALDARTRVHKALNIPLESSICLYAPTFRADSSMDAYRFDYELVTAKLEERFSKRFTFAYRLHPNIASLPRPAFLRKHIDASFYVDMQELLAACDVVITDYSSVMEDFMLTGKPGFVYAPDFDAYMLERSLYYPLEARPFPVAKSQVELIKAIGKYDDTHHFEDVESFKEFIGFEDDGCGDMRIAELMHKLTEPGTRVSEFVEDTYLARGHSADADSVV